MIRILACVLALLAAAPAAGDGLGEAVVAAGEGVQHLGRRGVARGIVHGRCVLGKGGFIGGGGELFESEHGAREVQGDDEVAQLPERVVGEQVALEGGLAGPERPLDAREHHAEVAEVEAEGMEQGAAH